MSGSIGALATSIRPTGAYLPRPERAAKVLARPCENQAGATGIHDDAENPLTFLNTLRAEIDLPLQTDEGRQAMLAATVTQLRDVLASEIFEFYASPSFFVCRLEFDGHAQTGVIADVALDAYDRGLVKVHELTRRAQEDRLFEYMSAVRASFLPIFLIHRPQDAVTAVIGQTVAQPPTIDVESDDGLRLTVWAITATAEVDAVRAALDELDELYVADGHHRAAAASRFAASSANANSDHTGDEAYAHMVSVLFSSDQLAIQPYDRCVTDLGGRSPEHVLAEVRKIFSVDELGRVDDAPDAGSYLMRLAERWYRVAIPDAFRAPSGVASLDVSVLHDHLLAPVLGIEDPRTDPKIEFVPGTRGMDELDKLCRGPLAASFALHPMSVADLMDVSDRNELLPPKSTYFVPKLRSGLIVRLF